MDAQAQRILQEQGIDAPEPYLSMLRDSQVAYNHRRAQEVSTSQADRRQWPTHRISSFPRLAVRAPPPCAPHEVLAYVGEGTSRTEFIVAKAQLSSSSAKFARRILEQEDAGYTTIYLTNEDPDFFAVFAEYLNYDCIGHRDSFAGSLADKGAQQCGRCGHFDPDGWDEMFLPYLYAFAMRHSITNDFDHILYNMICEIYLQSSTVPAPRVVLAAKCALKPGDRLYLLMLAFCLYALCEGTLDLDSLMRDYEPEIVQDIMTWDERIRDRSQGKVKVEEGEEMERMRMVFLVTRAKKRERESGCCRHEEEEDEYARWSSI